MTDVDQLICWNCLERTDAGICQHCGVQLSDPMKVEDPDDIPAIKRLIPIQTRDNQNLVLDIDVLSKLVRSHFKVEREIVIGELAYLVNYPEGDLDTKFSALLEESEALLNGLVSKVENYKNELLKINYFYRHPTSTSSNRTLLLLFLFSCLSILLAGLFNYSQLQVAIDQSQSSGTYVFGIILNVEAIIYTLQFSFILVVLLLIKDFHPVKSVLKGGEGFLSPFYIPAPPIFELGTLGSVYRQNRYHVTRKEMAKDIMMGPVISWLISLIIIISTLPLARYNPDAATLYANHSVLANGEYEPLILALIANFSNTIGITNLDLNQPLTQGYIFHPLTLGAIAGFYITSFTLLPASHLNGGFVIRSTFKSRQIHYYLTYVTIFTLLTIHWLLAAMIFLLHTTLRSPEILNYESGTASKWRVVVLALIIGLSLPIDISILSLY